LIFVEDNCNRKNGSLGISGANLIYWGVGLRIMSIKRYFWGSFFVEMLRLTLGISNFSLSIYYAFKMAIEQSLSFNRHADKVAPLRP